MLWRESVFGKYPNNLGAVASYPGSSPSKKWLEEQAQAIAKLARELATITANEVVPLERKVDANMVADYATNQMIGETVIRSEYNRAIAPMSCGRPLKGAVWWVDGGAVEGMGRRWLGCRLVGSDANRIIRQSESSQYADILAPAFRASQSYWLRNLVESYLAFEKAAKYVS
ncbi:Hypothetical predicted protein [Olea europaea subsp. europaea]|uniref:Uncharacterized protein n=1 Tax=Olea europaea subsp. europaea TaxID=158383 RepID=A0A8S0SLS9_OLEEU|nr:Hypothetical predicted protein [Olea europaea subsp. europaea]